MSDLPSASPTAPAPAPAPRLREQHDFLRLLRARVVSTSANQMLMVALGWQMYDLTGSAWDLGLVGLAQFLPALLLTLPAGHLVDHHDRRRLLALSIAVQAGVAAVLTWGSLAAWVGSELILGLSMFLGVARALQMPSLQALTPTLVPARLLPRAVAASSSTLQAAVVIGPALGGLLYAAGPGLVSGGAAAASGADGAHHGAGLVYAVSCLLLCLAVWGVLAIRHRAVPVPRGTPGWASLTAGVRFIWGRPVLLGAISLDLFAVLLGGATALLPIFAKDILHAGPTGLGLLRAAPAVGAVLVGVALARFPLERRTGHWLMGAIALFGLATLGFALAHEFWWAWVMLGITGAADMVSMVIRQSLVQLETPGAMRGRVGAVNSVFIGASNQLGEFESGATAALLGPVGSVVLGGVGTLLVVALWWRWFPGLAQRDRLQPAVPVA
jgi:MFS family permease